MNNGHAGGGGDENSEVLYRRDVSSNSNAASRATMALRCANLSAAETPPVRETRCITFAVLAATLGDVAGDMFWNKQ